MTDPKRQFGEHIAALLEAQRSIAADERDLGNTNSGDVLDAVANAFQALQERCGELEDANRHLAETGTDKATAWDAVAEKNERIAALEGTLKGSEEDPQLWRIEWLDALLQEIEAGNIGWLKEDEDPSATFDMLRECRELVTEGRQALAPGGNGGEGRDALTDLVARFSAALLEKLKAAREKYGYEGELWMRDDWRDDLLEHMRRHVEKGDPRDVAAYCAFAWHHGWSIAPGDDGGGQGWKCKADRSGVGGNDPQDCDWPVCGCDPYAEECSCLPAGAAGNPVLIGDPACPIHGAPQGKEDE